MEGGQPLFRAASPQQLHGWLEQAPDGASVAVISCTSGRGLAHELGRRLLQVLAQPEHLGAQQEGRFVCMVAYLER